MYLTSPYLQKVCSYNYIKRVKSNDTKVERNSRKKHQYDTENVVTCIQKQNDEARENGHTYSNRSASRTTLVRPLSAPILRTDSEVKKMHTKTLVKRRPSSYRKKPVVLKAITFKNGCNENPILITSHTIKHVRTEFVI